MGQGLTLIVPARNERPLCDQLWQWLQSLEVNQIIICDGYSDDGSYHWLQQAIKDHHGRQTILIEQCEPGRARQMNHGAQFATQETLVFVHADSQLSQKALDELNVALVRGAAWGRFRLRFDDRSPSMQLISWFMEWRSRLSGICTGDQTLFIRRSLFQQLGGYAEIALMEDIEISARLRAICWPTRLRTRVNSSARRWRQHGVTRTVLTMWQLRLRYWFGSSPNKLARRYYRSD